MNALKHRPTLSPHRPVFRPLPLAIVALALCLAALCSCADKNKDKQIAALIEKMKTEDRHWPLSKYPLEIAKFGDKATPMLLEEWKKSSDYVFWNLTTTLCKIPSKTRDEAFVEFLSNAVAREDVRIDDQYVTDMIDALAQNHCGSAIPLLEKIARRANTFPYIRSHAQAGLGLLESPLPPRPPEQFVVIEPSAQTSLKNMRAPLAVEAMMLVLDQALSNITTSTLILKVAGKDKVGKDDWFEPDYFPKEMNDSLQKINADTIQYDFGGRFTGHSGNWKMNLYLIDENHALVCASFSRGPRWAAGYTGLLIRRNHQWVLVKWLLLWA